MRSAYPEAAPGVARRRRSATTLTSETSRGNAASGPTAVGSLAESVGPNGRAALRPCEPVADMKFKQANVRIAPEALMTESRRSWPRVVGMLV